MMTVCKGGMDGAVGYQAWRAQGSGRAWLVLGVGVGEGSLAECLR